ncbi:HlyD family secretion protein [Christiangramia sp. LLG6405-1]|uniref:HlyD family secretion protein n=1 Tax=Christiangramia sp. LLG6405-1 TaxID=3160832 RepID=UPI003867FF8E
MKDKLDKIDLRSDEVQDILTRMPHWMIRWGNLLIFLIIILLLALSWVIKYPEVISSTVILTSEKPPQKIYAKTNGKIDALFVKDQTFIESGEKLAILKNTANYKDVFNLKKIVENKTLKDLINRYPDSLNNLFLGEIESSFAIFENNYAQYSLYRNMDPFSNKKLESRYTISELEFQLKNLITQKSASDIELNLQLDRFNRNKTLYEKGVLSSQEFDNSKMDYIRAQRANENYNTEISKTREQLSIAEIGENSINIEKVNQETNLYNNLVQSFDQLKESLKSWEENYVIYSDISGTVSYMDYWDDNSVVKSAEWMFTILPKNNSHFIARIRTPTINSAKLKIGEKIIIKLDNYPSEEYGTIVTQIDRLSLTATNSENFLAEAKLEKPITTNYNKHVQFKNGMRGTGEIITEDLRLIERVFYQFRKIFQK